MTEGEHGGPESKAASVNSSPEPGPMSATDLKAVYQRVQSLVASNAESMTLDMIGHARDGNYQAMKFLFEFAHLSPESVPSESAEADTLQSRLDQYSAILVKQKKSDEGNGPKPPAVP